MPDTELLYPVDAEKMPPGMYLGMFHGRDDQDAQMDDWGYNGPIIGPLTGYHVTYDSHVRIGFRSMGEVLHFFPDLEHPDLWVDLVIESGMLKYRGKFYGDWTVFDRSEF